MSISNKRIVDFPLISVVVPVYNVEDYLIRCIESILNQTYSNLELILIDDGSKDSSYNICKEYSSKDKRVIVRKQINAGSSVARNTGLVLAKGEFIGFVDSDDWIHPKMFDDMINLAISNNLPVIECSHATSQENYSKIKFENIFTIETQEEALERIINADNFAVWRRIYRSEVLYGKTFIPGKIHQDVFFTLDVLDQIKTIGVLSNKYYNYNVENESIIRSAYSLKKLDAKDAVYYVRDISSKYNFKLQEIGNTYLMKGLINHYIPLFFHENLDLNFKHRKQLKLEIKKQFTKLPKTWNTEKIRALIIKNSPFWFYKILLYANDLRIKFKLKLLKIFNV